MSTPLRQTISIRDASFDFSSRSLPPRFDAARKYGRSQAIFSRQRRFRSSQPGKNRDGLRGRPGDLRYAASGRNAAEIAAVIELDAKQQSYFARVSLGAETCTADFFALTGKS